MKPGDICEWEGRELFKTKHMHFEEVMRVEFGGNALVIALDSFDMLGEGGKVVTYHMVFVLVNDCFGWSPISWLSELQ